MECKLDEQKSSVVRIIEHVGSGRTYADATSSVQMVEQVSLENRQNLSVSSCVDEGYGGLSVVNVHSSSQRRS